MLTATISPFCFPLCIVLFLFTPTFSLLILTVIFISFPPILFFFMLIVDTWLPQDLLYQPPKNGVLNFAFFRQEEFICLIACFPSLQTYHSLPISISSNWYIYNPAVDLDLTLIHCWHIQFILVNICKRKQNDATQKETQIGKKFNHILFVESNLC